jgi:cation diffusion facilitator family transporter
MNVPPAAPVPVLRTLRAASARARPHTHAASLALAGIAVGAVVLAIKFAAYALTGSVALYSDALESTINVVAAAGAYAAVRIGARPADERHPYGYTKVEYFSAVLEGIMIALAAFAIVHDAVADFRAPRALGAPAAGIAANAAATAINAVWGWLLLRYGRRWNSPALVADGNHVLADVVTSAGVVVGVGLVALTGFVRIDPLVAVLVALNILRSGAMLVRDSLSHLLDAAAPPETSARIAELLRAEATGALQVHDIRTRVAANRLFIEFHLVVDGATTVRESHRICDHLEARLEEAFDGATITIHVEPDDAAEALPGDVP